jgi:hypothetical protein
VLSNHDRPRTASQEGTDLVRWRYPSSVKERSMADHENPNQKKPGEKEPGTFHYNPGNQSGKTVKVVKPEREQESNGDRIPGRQEQEDQKR